MLIKLSELKLKETLTTRKEKFNKCRTANGVITLTDLIQEKKEDIIELKPIVELIDEEKLEITQKETIKFKPNVEVVKEETLQDQEATKESKVVKLDTNTNSEIARTYTQQFKGGYFGKRKRF